MPFRGGEYVRTSQFDKFGAAQQTVGGPNFVSLSVRSLMHLLECNISHRVGFFFPLSFIIAACPGRSPKLRDDTGVM